MLDFSKLIDLIEKEWGVVTSAPILFAVAVLVAGVIIWRVIKAIKAGEVDGLKAQIGAHEARFNLASDQLKNSERLREQAEKDVKSLQDQTAKMAASTSPVTSKEVQALAFSSSNALTVLSDLSTSNTQIGTTLDPARWGQGKWGSGRWGGPTMQPAPQSPPKTKRDP